MQNRFSRPTRSQRGVAVVRNAGHAGTHARAPTRTALRGLTRSNHAHSKIPILLASVALYGLAVGALLLAAILGVAAAVTLRYYQAVVPAGEQTVAAFESQLVAVSLIEDRAGDTLAQLADPTLGTRVLISLRDVPQAMIWATLDTENRTFYTDLGVDPLRILSAARSDLLGQGGLQGASTITQQLVKLADFGPAAWTPAKLDQSAFQQKLKETMIAIGLTRDIQDCDLLCRKNDILEMYLNTVTYGSAGGDIDGVEAAAEYFFGLHASQLDLAQTALLAGLPQSPAAYDPRVYPERAKARQRLVLQGMVADHHITTAQERAALAEPLRYMFKSLSTQAVDTTNESYFVHWLLNDYLSQPANLRQFGIPGLRKPQDIYRGFIFQTTLDSTLQDEAQAAIDTQVEANTYLNITDGALVAIDPRSNEIEAYVGGVGYGSPENGAQYDMAWQPRQAGSSFKPFMYVTAFEHGHVPAEPILDAPVSYPQGPGEPPYSPTNYDMSFHGVVTLRQALANSYNVPAVKTLASLGPSGIAEVLQTTNNVGYHLEVRNPHDLGLAMTLGADPGRLLDEVNGYAVFANLGEYRPSMPILAIYRELPGGGKQLLWRYQTPKGVQVIAPQFAYLITNILSDTAAKVPAFGDAAYSLLGLPDRPVASKTGTTTDFKDNLTLGYTPSLVAGVWVGNPNDTPMYGTTGISGAAPAWHQFMQEAVLGTPPEQFVQPSGIMTATVAPIWSGGQRQGLVLSMYGTTDIFAAGTVPGIGVSLPGSVQGGLAPPATYASSQEPGTTVVTTTSPAQRNPCGGSAYRYTFEQQSGKLVYDVICT
jgi:membrane peptidoglycan carboxypeptidase